MINNHKKVKPKAAKRTMACIFLLGMFTCASLFAGNIYVNNVTGNDSNTGLNKKASFKTILKAVSVVKPGDVIHLLNTGIPYKESLVLFNRSGTPDARIIIDGHGSTISGSDPLNIPDWEQVAPGLYRNKVLYALKRFNGDVITRYFFLLDGKINRMGRCLKGTNVPLKNPSVLADNEWTFVDEEKAFYLKINPAKELAELDIKCPVRSNAVAISGNTSYITIRNLVCTNVYNDGFGLTNTANHLKLENIQSLYCGDDGISAHASVEFEVDGFVSTGNGTGICDTGNSLTAYNNVLIKDCIGFDLYFLNEKPDSGAIHSIKNSVILCNSAKPVMLDVTHPKASMDITMENVMVIGDNSKDPQNRVYGNTKLYAKNCTFSNLSFIIRATSVLLENSIVSGKKRFIQYYSPGVWQGRENIYVIDHFQFDSLQYAATDHDIKEYKTKTKDESSVWQSEQTLSSRVRSGQFTAGADVRKITVGNKETRRLYKKIF